MNLHLLYNHIRPKAGDFETKRVIISEDENFISDGKILFNRKFYYHAGLEKEVTLGKAQTISNDSIKKVIDVEDGTLVEVDTIVDISDTLFPTVKLLAKEGDETWKLNARLLSAFIHYLTDNNIKAQEFDLIVKYNKVTMVSKGGVVLASLGCLND